MELQLPRPNGPEATRPILRAQPSVNALALTMFEDTDTVPAAMRAGARGYILKDTDEEALADEVHTERGRSAARHESARAAERHKK